MQGKKAKEGRQGEGKGEQFMLYSNASDLLAKIARDLTHTYTHVSCYLNPEVGDIEFAIDL